ncbi:MAG: hypothetical protein RIR26_1040, partial [Pseudomonadota bacterium]
MMTKTHVMTFVGLLVLASCGRHTINEVSVRAAGLKSSGDRNGDSAVAMAQKAENVSEYECPPEEVAGSNLDTQDKPLSMDLKCGVTTTSTVVVAAPNVTPSGKDPTSVIDSGTGGTTEPPASEKPPPDTPTKDASKLIKQPVSNLSAKSKPTSLDLNSSRDAAETSATNG